jgi:hypothetical protein
VDQSEAALQSASSPASVHIAHRIHHAGEVGDMANSTDIQIPQKLYFSKNLGQNKIKQLKYPRFYINREQTAGVAPAPGPSIEINGKKIFISKTKKGTTPTGFDDVLIISDDQVSWAKQCELNDPKWAEISARRRTCALHLRDSFKLIEEKRNPDHGVETPGLRSPQIGAIYSALGHLRMSSDPST